MTRGTKQTIFIVAIVIASIAAGMIISADFGLNRKSAAQQAAPSIATPTMTIPSFADLGARVTPAVVSITTTEVVSGSARRRGAPSSPFDFFFPDPRQRPDGGQEDDARRAVSGGSGFIISPDGYIITNNHVVENATRVEVHYGEDETAEAKVVGRDAATDIALLKIEVKRQLPTAQLGDSDRIRVGDWAVAIGSPLQFENSLTVGVISGTGRAIGISEASFSFENFIQTDASINPGNSGGPLLNINGEVVGINTAIAGNAQGIGFATPINIAKRIYPQLKEKGKVTRGYLGINIREITRENQEAFGLASRRGALVESVVEAGPADKGGIQHGDVILQIDNVEIKRNRDLIDYVSSLAPGTNIKVTYIRDGKQRTTTAKTGERPAVGEEEESASATESDNNRARLGISVQELTPATRQTFGYGPNVTGVVVATVKDVSPAGEAGLLEGDLITEVNSVKITSLNQFSEIVRGARTAQYLRLYVTRTTARGGRSQSFFVPIRVP